MPSSVEPARVTLAPTGHFPRTARILKSWEFRRIQRDGVRIHARGFTVIARATLARGQARLGCAIGRKVGSAVLRNRLRRLLREVFRRARSKLPAVDIVVVVHPNASKMQARPGLDAVAREILPAFEQAASRARRRVDSGGSRRRAGKKRGPPGEKRP